MATEFDALIPTAGQDKFADFYTKYNDTMTALKAGTLNQVLAGNGAASDPTFKDIWDTAVVVGSGGPAPAFAINYAQSGLTADKMRYRKSAIMDTVEISGRFGRTTTTLADGSAAVIFILPAGYRPARAVVSIIRNSINFELLQLLIDPATGEVSMLNNAGTGMIAGTFFDVTFRFPIS